MKVRCSKIETFPAPGAIQVLHLGCIAASEQGFSIMRLPWVKHCPDCGRILNRQQPHVCPSAATPPTLADIKLRTTESVFGCWIWTGDKNHFGYGIVNFGGLKNRKRIRVHRYVWELTHGIIPTGQCVLHKCDNPSCCNPDHLFLGTRTDNAQDRDAKQRQIKGVQQWQHKLTPDEVMEIRRSGDMGTVLSERYGVSTSVISEIKNRKAWKHL